MTKEQAQAIVAEFARECGEDIEALEIRPLGEWYVILMPITEGFSVSEVEAERRASTAAGIPIYVVSNWNGDENLNFVSNLEHFKEGSEEQYELAKLYRNSYRGGQEPDQDPD